MNRKSLYGMMADDYTEVISSLKLKVHNHSEMLEYLRRVTDPKKSLPMTSKEIYVVIDNYLEDIKTTGGQVT